MLLLRVNCLSDLLSNRTLHSLRYNIQLLVQCDLFVWFDFFAASEISLQFFQMPYLKSLHLMIFRRCTIYIEP